MEDDMQKWDYWTVSQTRGVVGNIGNYQFTAWDPSIDLKQAGQEGWELVSVITVNSILGDNWSGVTSEITWIFKRPIE
jgi:hypothetical protein